MFTTIGKQDENAINITQGRLSANNKGQRKNESREDSCEAIIND